MFSVGFGKVNKRANSTKQGTPSTVINVNLKDGCSITAPVFLLKSETPVDYNFAAWDGRYYFVTDITYARNGLYEVSCTLDPMATYKAMIGSQLFYITRCANLTHYDGKITDTRYPSKVEQVTEVKNSTDSTLPSLVSVPTFVLRLQGCVINGATGCEFITMLDPMPFLTALSAICSEKGVSWTQYVSNVLYLPFSVTGTSVTSVSVLGETILTNGIAFSAGKISTTSATFALPKHPQSETRGEFLNGNAYTQGTLFYFPLGAVSLDLDNLIGKETITLSLEVDATCGIGIAKLKYDGKTVRTFDVNVGVSRQITQTQNNTLGAVFGFASAVASAAQGNVLGFASGVMSGVQSLRGIPETLGGTGSVAKFTDPIPFVRYDYSILVDEDLSEIGRPCCKVLRPVSVGGFMVCEGADISLNGFIEYANEINNYLNTGFFYE